MATGLWVENRDRLRGGCGNVAAGIRQRPCTGDGHRAAAVGCGDIREVHHKVACRRAVVGAVGRHGVRVNRVGAVVAVLVHVKGEGGRSREGRLRRVENRDAVAGGHILARVQINVGYKLEVFLLCLCRNLVGIVTRGGVGGVRRVEVELAACIYALGQ